jgi:hypothetical protein
MLSCDVHLDAVQARLAAYQEALSELVMYKSRIDVALLQVWWVCAAMWQHDSAARRCAVVSQLQLQQVGSEVTSQLQLLQAMPTAGWFMVAGARKLDTLTHCVCAASCGANFIDRMLHVPRRSDGAKWVEAGAYPGSPHAVCQHALIVRTVLRQGP